MKNFIKITLIICATFLFSNVKAQTEYYTLQDGDVKMFYGFITKLTEQGEQNVKDTSIIIPEQLHGQTVIGVANCPPYLRGVFSEKNLRKVNLPKTIEYLGIMSFFDNKDLELNNFTDLVNLKRIGWGSFCGAKGISNLERLDFSTFPKLEKIDAAAFVWMKNDKVIKRLDFTGCNNLKKIGQFAFMSSAKDLDTIILKNCSNLSYLGFKAFDQGIDSTINKKPYIDLSGCKSLLYVEHNFLGDGLNKFAYIEDLLPDPQINNLTFNGWKKIYEYESVSYLALFNETVISADEFNQNIPDKGKQNSYSTILNVINQQKNAKDSKQFKFKIRNHSINNVEISNVLCTTEGCTLDWTNGTIETGKSQIVTVTFPEGTEDYTATITIEGENLMGNTTVNISKTGEVTTDDNLLSGISQQEKQLQENDITVYPNPATDELHINLKKARATNHIKILNLQGKTVYENQEFKGSVINISKLPPAVYVILVNEKHTTFVKN